MFFFFFFNQNKNIFGVYSSRGFLGGILGCGRLLVLDVLFWTFLGVSTGCLRVSRSFKRVF